jgi:hypothetical protein
MNDFGPIFGLLTVLVVFLTSIAAYITHIVWWISAAMNGTLDTGGEITIAVLGTIVPFVGVIHGLIVWF